MIPTIQIVPNPMLQFVNLCNVDSLQYLAPLYPCSWPSFQADNFANLPLNFYSGFNSQPPILFFGDGQSTETSFIKSDLVLRESKVKEINSNRQNQIQLEEQRKENEEMKTVPAPLRKKLKFQNKILKITQNRNRNIIPSVVQQIFSYLSKPNKSKDTVLRVFALLDDLKTEQVTVRRYFYFIKQIKEKLNHYLNVNSLFILSSVQEGCLELVPEEEQLFYLNIARRVSKHFVENQLPLLIVHSKKMFEDKRAEHFKVRRMLVEVLQNLEC